jgi:hypothetical protein
VADAVELAVYPAAIAMALMVSVVETMTGAE